MSVHQMVLRDRSIASRLIEDDEESGASDSGSEFEECSDMEIGSDTSEEDGSQDEIAESENSDLSSRARDVRERGRPRSILHGKNHYTWRMKKPSRISGNFLLKICPLVYAIRELRGTVYRICFSV